MNTDFKDGTTAMIFQGPWEASNILLTGSAFASNKSNFGVAAIPTGPGGATGSPTGGQTYVIYAGTQHPSEAYKFISFMSSTASQIAIAKANHTLPTRQSAYQDSTVSADPVISGYFAVEKQTTTVRSSTRRAVVHRLRPKYPGCSRRSKGTTRRAYSGCTAWEKLLSGS